MNFLVITLIKSIDELGFGLWLGSYYTEVHVIPSSCYTVNTVYDFIRKWNLKKI